MCIFPPLQGFASKEINLEEKKRFLKCVQWVTQALKRNRGANYNSKLLRSSGSLLRLRISKLIGYSKGNILKQKHYKKKKKKVGETSLSMPNSSPAPASLGL